MESGGKYKSWESEEMRGGRRSCAWQQRLIQFSLKKGRGEKDKRDRGRGRGGEKDSVERKRRGRRVKYFQQKRERLVAQSL